jgi:HEAT repeat protein
MLSHPESQVRLVACKVLLQIGTEASLAPLAPLERDSDRDVASHATRALEVIRERAGRGR